MKIILAGMGAKSYERECLKYGMTKLYSALNERRQIDKWLPSNPMMVDSGAHSWNKIGLNVVGGKATAKLPKLSDWIPQLAEYYKRWDYPKWTLVELDTYAELPMPVIDQMAVELRGMIKQATFIRVYHLMLDDGKLTVLKKWLDEGYTYIGLGLDALPAYSKIFALTRDKIKYHGFAVTKPSILSKYPFYSADSSTAIAGARYGGNFVGLNYKSKERLYKLKHPSAMIDTAEKKIECGVRAMFEMQQFITKLWEKRGIVWD